MRQELQPFKGQCQEILDEFFTQISVALNTDNEKINKQINIKPEEQKPLKDFALTVAKRKMSHMIAEMSIILNQAEQGQMIFPAEEKAD
jgi:hypothetical protein